MTADDRLSDHVAARKRAEERYQSLFDEMLDGCGLHEIVCDDAGRPIDYRFLAVNPAFERLTGLRAADVVGRTVREVLPGIEPHWIETYGKVALTGQPIFFENHSAELKKHFQVTAYRPAPGQFACIFVDITERKEA
jgi:PAS domain S-box-containing protein